MNNLLFYSLAVGNDINYHLEAQMAIVSLLSHSNSNILLYTDKPNLYRWLEIHEKINISPIDKKTIDEWSKFNGKSYFYRSKLNLCHIINQNYPEYHNCWFDTDTVTVKNTDYFYDLLNNNIALMQKKEDPYSLGDTKAERAYWKHLENYQYKNFTVNQNSSQWNSGIIAVPKQNIGTRGGKIMLDLLDDMLEKNIPGRTLEQVAVGLTLENTGKMQAVDDAVFHYWNNKSEWHEFITEFLLNCFNQNEPITYAIINYKKLLQENQLPSLDKPKLSKSEKRKKKLRKVLGLRNALDY